MKIMGSALTAILIFIFIAGCAGNYGRLTTQSDNDSKVTQRELIDNWSAHYVYYTRHWREPSASKFKATLIVFVPKHNNKKILTGSNWSVVKDLQNWMEIVKENVTPQGNFALGPKVWASYPVTNVREIWGPDNQQYGIIIQPEDVTVIVKRVDENTIQLFWQVIGGGSPAR